MKSPRFKPNSITIQIESKKYPEIKEWLLANIGPKGSNPKGTNLWFGKWYAHEYDKHVLIGGGISPLSPATNTTIRSASHIIFYGKKAKDHATLFKLRWAGEQ